MLVIDDNPGDVTLLREAFMEVQIPLDLLVAENAVQAYAMMRDIPESKAPDIILIDLNLPVIKGQAVLRELSDFHPWRKSRKVVLSSSAASHEIAECLRLGAHEYVVKPTEFDDYIELARRLGCPVSGSTARFRKDASSSTIPAAATRRVRPASGSSQFRHTT
ncbi:MAG: response regulator [Planctomycetes bacterium]|nr:response regulator [Planctomycetota bacterium]